MGWHLDIIPPFAFLDGRNQEHYAILDRLKEVGKIKAYGASIDSVNEIEMLLKTTNATIIHAFFNVFHQDALDARSTHLVIDQFSLTLTNSFAINPPAESSS